MKIHPLRTSLIASCLFGLVLLTGCKKKPEPSSTSDQPTPSASPKPLTSSAQMVPQLDQRPLSVEGLDELLERSKGQSEEVAKFVKGVQVMKKADAGSLFPGVMRVRQGDTAQEIFASYVKRVRMTVEQPPDGSAPEIFLASLDGDQTRRWPVSFRAFPGDAVSPTVDAYLKKLSSPETLRHLVIAGSKPEISLPGHLGIQGEAPNPLTATLEKESGSVVIEVGVTYKIKMTGSPAVIQEVVKQ